MCICGQCFQYQSQLKFIKNCKLELRSKHIESKFDSSQIFIWKQYCFCGLSAIYWLEFFDVTPLLTKFKEQKQVSLILYNMGKRKGYLDCVHWRTIFVHCNSILGSRDCLSAHTLRQQKIQSMDSGITWSSLISVLLQKCYSDTFLHCVSYYIDVYPSWEWD